MKASIFANKGLKKMIGATAAVIGTSTLLFQGLTQVVTAYELNKVHAVPTQYGNVVATAQTALEHRVPDGYQKAHYTVKTIDLDYYRDKTPTSKDMSREEAAEIGAQALWEIFGLTLEGQVIEMGFHPATDNLPRSHWYADVYIDGALRYHFAVDSVTGELLTIGHNRTLDQHVSVDFDPELARNPQEYVAQARQLAETLNVVHGAIHSVEYNSQGYSNNDPTISLDIRGVNGEIALMEFSRYDQALLGIVYDGYYKPALESHERYVQEMLEKIKELERQPPSAASHEPLLRIVE